jgi:hypothetical protein
VTVSGSIYISSANENALNFNFSPENRSLMMDGGNAFFKNNFVSTKFDFLKRFLKMRLHGNIEQHDIG